MNGITAAMRRLRQLVGARESRTTHEHRDRGSPAASALYARNGNTKSPDGGGRVEYARPGARGAGLYRRQRLAQSRGILLRPRSDRRIPPAQMGERTGLPADEGALGVPREPHRGAVSV